MLTTTFLTFITTCIATAYLVRIAAGLTTTACSANITTSSSAAEFRTFAATRWTTDVRLLTAPRVHTDLGVTSRAASLGHTQRGEQWTAKAVWIPGGAAYTIYALENDRPYFSAYLINR